MTVDDGGRDDDACRTALAELLGGWPAPVRASTPATKTRGETEAESKESAKSPRTTRSTSPPAERSGRSTGELADGVRDRVRSARDGWPAGCTVDTVAIPPTRRTATDAVGPLPGTFVRPAGAGPFPAVLYCHAHGNAYGIGRRELLDGRPALPSGPYGPVLAARGIASLCIDLPGFGERATESESSLAKRFLWHGDTLFGSMLRELAAALDWLADRDDVDASRLATLGLSMGATTAWWLAALDRRVCAVAELCCLADVEELLRLGAHDAHGIYLTVPGLIARYRSADVAALICPRPHLVGLGDADPLTPPSAADAVLVPLRRRYAAAGAADALDVVRSADEGHVETPAMRRAALDFLDRALHRPSRAPTRSRAGSRRSSSPRR